MAGIEAPTYRRQMRADERERLRTEIDRMKRLRLRTTAPGRGVCRVCGSPQFEPSADCTTCQRRAAKEPWSRR